MSRKYLQELIRNLQEFYKCPSCDTNYFFDDIKFLGEIDQYCFVQLSCHQCSMPVLATVSVQAGEATPKRGKNELTAAEKRKFSSRGAISAAEIAEFHRFISDWEGDLANLGK
jgi:hypothetical protein